MSMEETYYEDEDGILRGVCPRHGEFVGDAIGCPVCFAEQVSFSFGRNSKPVMVIKVIR